MGRILDTLITLGIFVILGWQVVSTVDSSLAGERAAQIQYGENWRNPAAIRKNLDFSRLSGPALKKASHRRLTEDIRLVLNDERFGIELGHFVVQGAHGEKEFACEFYDRVQLQFAAQGVAINGKIPQLIVEGNCRISKDINRMTPLWLPIDELKEMPPRNLTSYYFEKEQVFVSVENIDSSWPKHWELKTIRVFNQVKIDREVAVDAKSDENKRLSPVTISF